MDTISKFTIPGLIFLMTLAAGLWLSQSGKPLNTVIFAVHKLIALGAVVVTAIKIFSAIKTTETQFLLIALIVVAGLCVIALFATGAVMSLGKLDNGVMLTIHQIAPILATIAMAVTLYLLAGRKL